MYQAGPFIRSLVEGKSPNVIETIGSKLDLLSRAILTGTKFAREAMTDLLKFTFNLLLHYPKVRARGLILPSLPARSTSRQLVDDSDSNDTKVMGDCWSDRLDGCVSQFHLLERIY